MLTNSNDLLGHALGTCTLKRLIGRGGMGAVYLAQQSRPRRIVAVKVLLPHIIDARPREEFLARFRREADAIAALDHINIMPIYEYGEQGEAAYLVMPYVTGGTLRERLEAQPIPSVQNTVSVIEQVAAGLDSAHELGIIHRDLKPGNILFHADGRILITDFGLAKMLKDATEHDSGAHALTSAGSIIGTPEYLSPEQGTGNPTDYHTDIYSLGVVLYQMLAGRVPFIGTTPVAVAIKHALQEPPPVTQFNSAVPHSVEAVVMKALAKAPEQRFASAGEMARALRLAISNESATTIWKALDVQPPSEPTVPTTDSPKLAEPVQDQIDQGKEERGTKNAKSHIEENIKNDQDVESEAALPANPINQIVQEETTQEGLTTLPTLLTGPDGDELHNATTVDDSPTDKQDKAKPLFPPVITPTEGMREDKLEVKALQQEVELPAFMPETEQPQHAAAQGHSEQGTRPRTPILPTPETPQQDSQTRLQPIWKMLIGGFLALLIIVGGLTTYTHLLPTGTTPKHETTPISDATSTASSQNQTPTVAPSPVAIQPAIQAGTQIYGTQQPFTNCDKQGGHWSNTSNAQVTCNSGGSQIVNTSGHLVTVNLNQLPTNQYPGLGENFIVQVQININANSQGTFGVDLAPQTDNNAQQYFAYMLNGSGTIHTFNQYDNQGNVLNTVMTTGQPISSVSIPLTLDIRVTGTSYAFFINGKDTADRAETGSQYIDRIIGLAVDANANVTFSNFAIYTLS